MSSSTKTILVIDDDRDMIESIKIMLETAGFEVITAEDGQVPVWKSKLIDFGLAREEKEFVGLQVDVTSDTPILVRVWINGTELTGAMGFTGTFDPVVSTRTSLTIPLPWGKRRGRNLQFSIGLDSENAAINTGFQVHEATLWYRPLHEVAGK